MLKLGIDSQPDLQPSGLADVQERMFLKLGGRDGNTHLGGRIGLLGVNYAVANYTATGEIKIEQTPTEMRPVPKLPIPSNLGVCVKASRILDFEPLLVALGLRPPDGYVIRAEKP
jgi:hypothetical protein